jgi:hypothetical protein
LGKKALAKSGSKFISNSGLSFLSTKQPKDSRTKPNDQENSAYKNGGSSIG